MAKKKVECAGYPQFDVPPHKVDALAGRKHCSEHAGTLNYHRIRYHWRRSQPALAEQDRADTKAYRAGKASTRSTEPQTIIDGTAVQAQEHTQLEQAVEAAGGVGTDAGQQLLADAAEAEAQARAEARRAKDRARKAAERAAKKAAQVQA